MRMCKQCTVYTMPSFQPISIIADGLGTRLSSTRRLAQYGLLALYKNRRRPNWGQSILVILGILYHVSHTFDNSFPLPSLRLASGALKIINTSHACLTCHPYLWAVQDIQQNFVTVLHGNSGVVFDFDNFAIISSHSVIWPEWVAGFLPNQLAKLWW